MIRNLLHATLYGLVPLFAFTVVGTITARLLGALTVAQQNLAGDMMLQEFSGIILTTCALHAHTFFDD